jgi:multiple sugar transport system substrate-binding protein
VALPLDLRRPRRVPVAWAAAWIVTLVVGPACERHEASVPAAVTLLVPASERPFWAPVTAAFEAAHPGTRVVLREGPNSTDLRENLYTAALLAEDDSLDLVYMDVTWTAKLAAAGWLVPLDERLPPEAASAFLPAAVEAGRVHGRLYRIPLRTDIGLLYYRRDLLEAAGLAPPRTAAELLEAARRLQAPPQLWGFVWQGSQYEGLVCFYLEVLRGHGGFWIDPRTLEVGLDRPEAAAALEFLLRCRREGVSPPGVTTYKEEESRRLFQDGRSVFLRNWAYVWGLSQREDSPVRGKVGVVPMVHGPGGESGATLGGWGLGISRFSRDPDLAAAFLLHAASLESQRALCRPTGFAPARLDAYRDPELLAANPFLAELARFQRHAVARPAIPRYALASDILQRRLSAALSGLEPPERALASAARETRRLLGGETR